MYISIRCECGKTLSIRKKHIRLEIFCPNCERAIKPSAASIVRNVNPAIAGSRKKPAKKEPLEITTEDIINEPAGKAPSAAKRKIPGGKPVKAGKSSVVSGAKKRRPAGNGEKSEGLDPEKAHEHFKAYREKTARKKRRNIIIGSLVIVLCVILNIKFLGIIFGEKPYERSVRLMKDGDALMASGKHEQALEAYKAAIKAFKSLSKPYVSAGRAAFALGRFEEAEYYNNKVVEGGAYDRKILGQAYVGLAKIEIERENFSNAEKLLVAARTKGSGGVEASRLLNRIRDYQAVPSRYRREFEKEIVPREKEAIEEFNKNELERNYRINEVVVHTPDGEVTMHEKLSYFKSYAGSDLSHREARMLKADAIGRIVYEYYVDNSMQYDSKERAELDMKPVNRMLIKKYAVVYLLTKRGWQKQEHDKEID